MWSGKDLHFLQSERLPVLRGSHRRHAWLILGGNKANIAVCQTRKRARHQRAASRSLSFTLTLSISLSLTLSVVSYMKPQADWAVCVHACVSSRTQHDHDVKAHSLPITLTSQNTHTNTDAHLFQAYMKSKWTLFTGLVLLCATYQNALSPVEHVEIIGHITRSETYCKWSVWFRACIFKWIPRIMELKIIDYTLHV